MCELRSNKVNNVNKHISLRQILNVLLLDIIEIICFYSEGPIFFTWQFWGPQHEKFGNPCFTAVTDNREPGKLHYVWKINKQGLYRAQQVKYNAWEYNFNDQIIYFNAANKSLCKSYLSFANILSNRGNWTQLFSRKLCTTSAKTVA